MRFPACALLAIAAITTSVQAFAPQSSCGTPSDKMSCGRTVHSREPVISLLHSTKTTLSYPFPLFSTTESDEASSSSSSSLLSSANLSDDEWQTVKDLVKRANNDSAALQELVAQTLPTMHPSFIIKLKSVEQQEESNDDDELWQVAQALRSVLDTRLASGRQVLAELLAAGEIRKLDAAIGKFARQGQLDMAFFTVLNMNMQDALVNEGNDNDANRSQILQHVYTRCQEEVEKTVPGGVALLNKLLRTEMESIRSNQLEHYLCPQPNVITTPDGKQIELKGEKPVLVPPSDFVDAIAGAVKQVRTVEKAGGTDAESAANLVESCRQVASEARIAIAKNYGTDSDELKQFEDSLMPVFRPQSPDSPYIKGQ